MHSRALHLGLLPVFLISLVVGLPERPASPPTAPAAEPPQPYATSSPPLSPGYPGWNNWKVLPGYGTSGTARASGAGPSMTLGQPGLSFRYLRTFGVSGEAYPGDAYHLNGPNGIYADGSGNVLVVEERGSRLLGYNASGTNTLEIGTAGSKVIDNYEFTAPKDVTVDASGNIWVVDEHRVTQYNASGTFLEQFPSTDPWNSGSDNGHFDTPRGIAFDKSGKLYVSDTNNHRIQIFDMTSGSPVYSATLGTTGTPQSDNSGFNQPAQIVFDSLGRLYVLDTGNYRVQRCSYSSGWTCGTYFGVTGVYGTDLTHLGQLAFGIGIDSSDTIYLADGSNARVLKCDTSGTCSLFAGVTGQPSLANDHLMWSSGVAAIAGGNVYVSDYYGFRVQIYNSGGVYQRTIGTAGVPYVPDATHLNTPFGIGVASDGSVYVTEESGYRLVKFSAGGTEQWAYGQAGLYGSDNGYMGAWWAGPEGAAVDASGNVYVADTGNQRILKVNSGGTLAGPPLGGYGTGDYEFNCPRGIAIGPLTGDVFVADACNDRVQVYNSSLVYQATLGVTGVPGSDNAHFNDPWGVAVDASNNIYVAEHGNNRVQKCTLGGSSGTCTAFLGETGVWGNDFGHLSLPVSVAVDTSGRVYVVDEANSRVQVVDSSGAYLTTIGGSWGTNTGDMRDPRGVALDAAGDVYVTDWSGQRMQEYAPGVPGWTQSNLNGFGDINNQEVLALAAYGGDLYAATLNQAETGAQVWRLGPGGWEQMVADGFGNSYNVGIDQLYEFGNKLYAATWADITHGAEIWRSSDSGAWSRVVADGFGDPTNAEVHHLDAYAGQIYAATYSYSSSHGSELWRSSTGDLGSWTRAVANGFGDPGNIVITDLQGFGGSVFAGTFNTTTGSEVWESSTGDAGTWTQVGADGFGEGGHNGGVTSMADFRGMLYASVTNCDQGGEVWRTSDGTTWNKVVTAGFGNTNNCSIDGLIVFGNRLYAVTYNHPWLTQHTGAEVWRTSDGVNWEQVGPDGLGSSNTVATHCGNAVALFEHSLFVGTRNPADGGGVWRLLEQAFPVSLPLVLQ